MSSKAAPGGDHVPTTVTNQTTGRHRRNTSRGLTVDLVATLLKTLGLALQQVPTAAHQNATDGSLVPSEAAAALATFFPRRDVNGLLPPLRGPTKENGRLRQKGKGSAPPDEAGDDISMSSSRAMHKRLAATVRHKHPHESGLHVSVFSQLESGNVATCQNHTGLENPLAMATPPRKIHIR
ncbi:unnamed protein product [Cuscuta campestris]|uniref:Uncharacterized protein n=1 Tax=Cuscuta campestris TaxID=132261 RepID=A0A484L9B8_9ASTE|nr:unnamed protein product [Cuscuta campestris]